MLRPRLSWLLALVPVSLVAEFVLGNEVAAFVTAAGAVIPLAGYIGRATDELALHAGPRVGGLLNATFGNVAELIISVFLILEGNLEIVKASLVGSIIGNLLLVLGVSFFVGGLRHHEQHFNQHSAAIYSSSLALAVIGLLMPALFALSTGSTEVVQRRVVSVTVAAVLIALYAGALLFTMVTHQHLFRTPSETERATWSVRTAVLVLIASTAFVALESEILVEALGPALSELGLSELFVGLILVPIIGNAAEHSSAVAFALRNKVDVTLEIAIGSSTQIALFVAPLLVFLSFALGHPMDFVFDTFEVAAVGLSTVIVAFIAQDGRSNWLEGAQLTGAYVIMAVSFFFVRAV